METDVHAFEQGELIELERRGPPTEVLSVRLPQDVLRALTERARRQGKRTSQLARELIEAGLHGDRPATPRELAQMFARWVEEAEDR